MGGKTSGEGNPNRFRALSHPCAWSRFLMVRYTMSNDPRLNDLKDWLKDILGRQPERITPLAGDASFRRYFRVSQAGRSWVIMDAPPARENCRPFVMVANELTAMGLVVPKVLAWDESQGFLLLSDLGDETYLTALQRHDADPLYRSAINALVRMQALGKDACMRLPAYDDQLLHKEMGLFREWFLTWHLGLELSPEQTADLDQVNRFLAETALNQPQVFVHRDYHSRNLMVQPDGAPGIIDFQDAVAGPITYDLVSLLRDCYVAWPAERLQGWLKIYYEQATQQGLLDGIGWSEFVRMFDLMGVQRHLKAVGIFSRLYHRDHKAGYLGDIPRTLGYLHTVSGQYAELTPLHNLLSALPDRPAP